jgi:hypothetical protein
MARWACPSRMEGFGSSAELGTHGRRCSADTIFIHPTSGSTAWHATRRALRAPAPRALSGEGPRGASQDLEKAGAKLGVISQAVKDVVQVRSPSLAFGREARSQRVANVESPLVQPAEGD